MKSLGHAGPGPASHKRVVAESCIVTVEACDCGVVHLHFGPMSIRVTRSGLETLQETLGRAVASLSREDTGELMLSLAGSGQVRGQA